jgi:UDP-N-acetyl-D-glucosamine dehydrogenase
LENIFRSVNIALVNELKIVYGAMGIDISEVINAAKTKLFGLMAFYPATAWGHCIQLIRFISHGRRGNTEKNTRFIELAGEINTSMPERVVHRVERSDQAKAGRRDWARDRRANR